MVTAPQDRSQSERIFKLRVREDAEALSSDAQLNAMTVGELWQGKGRVPVSGVLSYRGRVDGVITFFVDQFMSDEIFQPGDSLVLAGQDDATAPILLARKKGSA